MFGFWWEQANWKTDILGDSWRNLSMIGFQMMLRDCCNFVKCDSDIVITFKKVSLSVKYALWFYS